MKYAIELKYAINKINENLKRFDLHVNERNPINTNKCFK